MKYRARIVGVALLWVAFGSEAFTLGRVRGATLVGHPLNMVVQVQTDAGEDAASLCFDADVFHADTRQDASRVRVVVEATSQPNMTNVRILSSAVVDEPVVTVYLRTGCGQKTTRRYVLLADLPSEDAVPSVPSVPRAIPVSALPPAQVDVTSVAPVSSGLPSMTSMSAPADSVSPVKAKTTRALKQTARRGVAINRPEVKSAAASPKGAMLDEKSKAGRAVSQSQLKLDPLGLLSDRVANLDSFMTFAPPEDFLRSMEKMQALEGDVKALRALAAKSEASLVDLKARLQKAESERFSGGVIYGLIALVLVNLAVVALLWTRQRRAQAGDDDWWSASIAMPAPPEPGPLPEPVAAPRERDEVRVSKKSPLTIFSELSSDSGRSSNADVNQIDMSDSNFNHVVQPGAGHSANHTKPPSPVKAPQKGLARSLHSEAMLDIRHQAEFFVSLGQTDQAVRILKEKIEESDAPNPFVYLDLLNIVHSLSLKMDFQQLREDFNRLFNGNIPEFEFFKDEGQGLESYPDVLSRITALWPTPKVLEVIEACIYQDSRDAKRQLFDLAAFRDLLLLHAVAQSVVLVPPPKGGEPGIGSSPSTDALSHFADAGYAEGGGVASNPLTTGTLGSGNLINFELPEAPKQAEPAGNKSGQQSGP